MGYQENLFQLNVMQDRSGRIAGKYKLNITKRSQCKPGMHNRSIGVESCPFVNCEYHLVGEAMRIPDSETAAKVQASRWEGDIHHTCVLDFAETDEGDDEKIGRLLGIEPDLVPQRIAEASFKMRKLMKTQQEQDDCIAGLRKEADNEADEVCAQQDTVEGGQATGQGKDESRDS